MARVVLDTNVLVAAARSPHSASRKILTACLDGSVEVVVSQALRSEYELIIEQALRGVSYAEKLRGFIDGCVPVEPASVPRVVPDDAEDDKLVALAIAADTDALVTSDVHLLSLHPYEGIPILTPGEMLRQFPDVVS